jgi:hypothetical protein
MRFRSLLIAACLALAAGPGAAREGNAIALPWIGQKTASDCGRAVLASLKARGGGSAEQAYRRIHDPADPSRGYSISEMRRLGGLSVMAPAGIAIAGDCAVRPPVVAHFAHVKSIVGAGHPVVVPVSAGFSSGHYLILAGTTADGFMVHDPAAAGLRAMSTSSLMSSMCGFGYIALR